jgi:hypothetical protein
MEEDEYLSSETQTYETGEGPQPGNAYGAVAPFDASLFTPEELNTLQEVVTKLGHLNAKQLSERSHLEAAWRDVPGLGFIPYTKAQELRLD